MKLGESSGSDYELEGILSTFCFHYFVKYDICSKNKFSLGPTIIFKTTFNCSHLKELDSGRYSQKIG